MDVIFVCRMAIYKVNLDFAFIASRSSDVLIISGVIMKFPNEVLIK